MKIKTLTQTILGSLALLSALLILTPTAGHASALTPGNLVVFRVGDGSAALTSASTAAFLVEYTPSGTLVQSIALPTTAVGGNQALTCNGTATSEGFIARSANGAYMTCCGYNAVPGVAAINGTASTLYSRGVGRVGLDGTIDTTTALSDAYSAANVRSAVSSDGSSFWLTGSAGGSRYATLGATASTVLNTANPVNLRVANIFNNQLYISTASSGVLGIATVGTGLPTSTGQTITELAGMPTTGTHSPYGFWFKDANTLYVADDGAVAAGGGIQKWTYSGSTWTLAYTLLNNGTTTTGCRSVTGTVVGGNTVLYATSSATGTPLITVTDTGAGATATTLATAPANTAFRSVIFGPVPPLLLSATAAPAAGSLTVGANDVPVFGFQLTPTGIPSYDFTTLTLTTAGTATSSDLSNFRVVYDADNSGTYNTGDSIVSGSGSLPGPISFTIDGTQTGITATRSYLVIANVAAGATPAHTFRGSIAALGAGTSPVAGGTATGNLQNIGIDMTMATANGESATISSLVNDAGPLTSTSGAQVWQVLFNNPAGNAGAGTISAITFTKGAANTVADWSTTIQAAELFDGTTALGAGTVSATSIAFSGLNGGVGVTVADGGSKTLSLRISLKSTPTLTDNAVLQFALAGSDVTSSGNGVITPSINSASGQNVITVVATKLAFTSPNPSTTYFAIINGAFTGTVQAQDANGNLDADASSGVTVTKATGPGTFTCIGGPATLVHGVVSWPPPTYGFTFDTVGAYTLTATSDSGLTAATSGTITVQLAATLTDVIVPQYIQGITNGASSNAKRLPFAYRVTLGSLTPNATYRYYNMCSIPSDVTAGTDGAGNFIIATPSGNFVWVNSSTAAFGTPGTYGTFTTDSSGNYTGWFIAEPTANASRFVAGTAINMQIMLNNGADGTFVLHRVRSTETVTVLPFGTDSASGTGIHGNSYATAKNFVMLYDNTTGLGAARPLTGTFVESDGVTETSYATFYSTLVDGVAGAWGAIIPNNNPNGVQRIEERALADGSVVLASTDSDGVWPSTASTVNPTGGDTTPIVITASDAPLGTAPPPPASTTISSIVNNGDGTVTINYTGGVGGSFTLMKSSVIPTATGNRDNWTPVGANQPSTPGSFTITPAGNEFYTIRSN
jgi:hypothetical protein